MNYKQFSIRGTNPETGRKKTITLDVPNITTPNEMVLQQKILDEPLEINEIPFRSPSDRQLEYANDLGIKIPQEACLEDVSALISCAVDFDSAPNQELVEYATNRGLIFSKYIGKKALYNLIFYKLPLVDKIAFFCFSIYRYLSDDRHGNLDTSPNRDAFYSFAKQYEEDKKFTASMMKYEGKDLRFFGSMRIKEGGESKLINGGSIATLAYKTAAEFLHSKFNTPLTYTKKIQGEADFESYRKSSYKNTSPKTPPNKKDVLKGFGVILILIGVVGLFIDFITGLVMIGIGIVLIIYAKKKGIVNLNKEDMPEQAGGNDDSPQLATEALNDKIPCDSSAKIDPTVELKKYKELLDTGVITQEDFDAKKKQLLNL